MYVYIPSYTCVNKLWNFQLKVKLQCIKLITHKPI